MHLNARAVAALILLSLVWGYSWIVMKVAMEYADPFDFAALRTLLGGACLLAVLVAMRKPLEPQRLRETFILGLLQTTVFVGLSMMALAAGGAGKTAILVFTMPFWTLLFAWPLLHERLQGSQWAAVACAAVGLVCILEPWQLQAGMKANLLAVAGGMVWALSAIYAKRMQARGPLDLLSLTTWQMLLGAIPLIAAAALIPSAPIRWTPVFVGALVFASVLTTALGWVLWLYILRRLPAGSASMSSLANPVIAILASWIQLGEQPSGAELAGMMLIAIALGMLSLRALRIHRDALPEAGPE